MKSDTVKPIPPNKRYLRFFPKPVPGGIISFYLYSQPGKEINSRKFTKQQPCCHCHPYTSHQLTATTKDNACIDKGKQRKNQIIDSSMQIILQRLQRTDNTVGSRFDLFQFGNLLISQYDTSRFHHRETCNCMTNMLDIFSNIQTGFAGMTKL